MVSDQEYHQSIEDYTKNLFMFLFKSPRDEDAVNDIIQDCFLKLWQNRSKMTRRKIKQWLFSVVHAMKKNMKCASGNVSLKIWKKLLNFTKGMISKRRRLQKKR